MSVTRSLIERASTNDHVAVSGAFAGCPAIEWFGSMPPLFACNEVLIDPQHT